MTPIKTYLHDAGRIGDGFGQKETGRDCAVRAYAIAKEIPYYEAHELFKKAGRRDNHGTSRKLISEVFGFKEQTIGESWRGITLTNFLKNFSVGTYYVYNRNHAFVIKDGIVFDNRRHTGKTKVYGYWKVEVK